MPSGLWTAWRSKWTKSMPAFPQTRSWRNSWTSPRRLGALCESPAIHDGRYHRHREGPDSPLAEVQRTSWKPFRSIFRRSRKRRGPSRQGTSAAQGRWGGFCRRKTHDFHSVRTGHGATLADADGDWLNGDKKERRVAVSIGRISAIYRRGRSSRRYEPLIGRGTMTWCLRRSRLMLRHKRRFRRLAIHHCECTWH